MPSNLLNLLIGFILAALIGLAAWRARALSVSGALAAWALGTIIFGLGGLGWAVVLMGFFVSSSALSRVFKKRKASLDEKFSKGSQRDAGQVLANGGIAGLFALLYGLDSWNSAGQINPDYYWVAFAGALAAANADTWATELGVLNRGAPRLITTGREVERGTSGGISALGTLAAASGSLLIGILAILCWRNRVFPVGPADTVGMHMPFATLLSYQKTGITLVFITLAGLVGSLFDSFLGATVQAIYYCPSCQKETEQHPQHLCGTPTTLVRGWPWLDNDWVNTGCTLIGALIALLFTTLFFGI